MGYVSEDNILYSILLLTFSVRRQKLVIEVDGGIHKLPSQFEYDRNRDYELHLLGIKVLRFTNEEVLNNIESVIDKIIVASKVP